MASSFSASPSSSTVYLWLQSVHVQDTIVVSVSFFVCCVPLIAKAVQDCILFFLPACRGRHGKQPDRYSVMANEAQKRKENHYNWLQSLFKTHSRHCHLADSSIELMTQPAFVTLVIISSSLISLWYDPHSCLGVGNTSYLCAYLFARYRLPFIAEPVRDIVMPPSLSVNCLYHRLQSLLKT